MRLVHCDEIYPPAVFSHKATCPESAAGKPGLWALARATPAYGAWGWWELRFGLTFRGRCKTQGSSGRFRWGQWGKMSVRKCSRFSLLLSFLLLIYLQSFTCCSLNVPQHTQSYLPCFSFSPGSACPLGHINPHSKNFLGNCPGSQSILSNWAPWL